MPRFLDVPTWYTPSGAYAYPMYWHMVTFEVRPTMNFTYDSRLICIFPSMTERSATSYSAFRSLMLQVYNYALVGGEIPAMVTGPLVFGYLYPSDSSESMLNIIDAWFSSDRILMNASATGTSSSGGGGINNYTVYSSGAYTFSLLQDLVWGVSA